MRLARFRKREIIRSKEVSRGTSQSSQVLRIITEIPLDKIEYRVSLQRVCEMNEELKNDADEDLVDTHVKETQINL